MLGDSVPKVITPDEGSTLVSEGSFDEGRTARDLISPGVITANAPGIHRKPVGSFTASR